MRIDIRSPDGNTLTALGYARQLMKRADHDPKDIEELTKAVLHARSADDARAAITAATYDCIEFYDSALED